MTHHEGFEQTIPAWTLAPRPTVDVGETEGSEPYLLTEVRSGLRLSDGRFVVVEGLTSEVRFFDPDGRFLYAAGGEGAGPGEFRSILRLVRAPGDTLVAWDSRLRRITWLSPEGELVRVAPTPPPGTTHYGALLGDGSRVLPHFEGSVVPDRPGLWRPTTRLVRADQATGAVDSIGIWRGREMVSSPGGAPWNAPAPRETIVATAGTAGHFAVVDTETFDIALHSVESGAPEIRIRRSYGPEPLHENQLGPWRDRVSQEAGATGRTGEAARALRLVDTGSLTAPALVGLFLDPAGGVWAEEYTATEDTPWRVTIFDAEGVPRARVEAPAELDPVRILDVWPEGVLVVHQDDLGVIRVRSHRIVK